MIQDPDPTVDVELEKFCDWLSEDEDAYKPFSMSFQMMKAVWIFGKAGHDAWKRVFVPRQAREALAQWEKESTADADALEALDQLEQLEGGE